MSPADANLIPLPDPDEPEPVAEPVVPAVESSAAEPPIGAIPDEDLSDIEPQVVTDTGGERRVPVKVVAEERRKAREAKDALRTTQEQLGTLIRAIQEAKSHAETQPPIAPIAPVSDPIKTRAERIARTLDLYDRDGQPDLARAKTFLDDQDAEVERRVKASIGPEITTRQTERSATNFKRAVAHAKGRGVAVDEQVLQQLWAQFPPEITSDERAASVILAAAASYDKLFGPAAPAPRAPVTKPGEPLVVEAPSARPGPVRLSASQQQAARMTGVSEKEFAAIVDTIDFSKTGSVALED